MCPGPKRIYFISGIECCDEQHHYCIAALRIQHHLPASEVIALSPRSDGSAYRSPIGELKRASLDVRPGTAWFQLRLLLKILKSRLSLHSLQNTYYVNGHNATPASFLALLGVPRSQVVYHTQDFLEPGRHPLWEFFERRVCKRAMAVVVNEQNRGRFMCSNYRLREMPLVVPTYLPRGWPQGPDREAARKCTLETLGLPKDAGTRLIIAGGAYKQVRCGPALATAVAKLPNQYALVFTGASDPTAEAERIRNHMRGAGANSNAFVLPFLDDHAMRVLYAAGDVGMLLYENDGIGNYYQCPGRLTQYLRAGLPIVCSNHVGLELLVRKWDLGEPADATSPSHIAKCIHEICDVPMSAAAARRRHLIRMANDELCYENHEMKIINLFSPSPRIGSVAQK